MAAVSWGQCQGPSHAESHGRREVSSSSPVLAAEAGLSQPHFCSWEDELDSFSSHGVHEAEISGHRTANTQKETLKCGDCRSGGDPAPVSRAE